jgi:ankyrin repeat protein
MKSRTCGVFAVLLALTGCSLSPTSIQEAAQSGDTKAVEKFVNGNPASVKEAGGPQRMTALHLAKTAEIVELLIAKGADVKAVDMKERPPVATAASAEVVEALIKHGADVHQQGSYGIEPIFQCEHPGAVSALVAHGASVNASLPNQPYKTPLYMAIVEGRPEVAKALLQSGAAASLSDSYGTTYLHEAVDKDLSDVVEALIAAGASVDASTKTGETPLIRAALRNALKSAEVLLLHKADPNRTLSSDVSMLSLSMNGSKSGSPDVGGKSALALASSPQMKELLQKNGAH